MPCTRLSLTSPNVNLRIKTELQSKSHQPEAKTRVFHVDDPVLIRELRPGQHTKWQKGTITAPLGCPRCLVNVGGEHIREVHVDHLQPGVKKEQVSAEPFIENSKQSIDNPPVPPPRRSNMRRFSNRDY